MKVQSSENKLVITEEFIFDQNKLPSDPNNHFKGNEMSNMEIFGLYTYVAHCIKLKETKPPTWKCFAYTHTMHIGMGSKGQNIVVILHIKLKGMKCRRTCKQKV